MDLTALTLDEFLGGANPVTAPADPGAFTGLAGLFDTMIGRHLRSLGQGYTVHQFAQQNGDVLLVLNGVLVGFYVGETLAIHPEHQGRNLSVPLILAAVPDRDLPTARTFSPGGLAALTKAWRVANGLTANPWP